MSAPYYMPYLATVEPFILHKSFDKHFIISSAFIDLGFPALNSALLNEVPDSFLHEFHRLEIHPTYVMLNLSYDL